MGNGNLKPSEIRFTRDKIESEFANGRKLTDTFEELLYKRIPTKFIEDIEVVYVDGAWWALTGNRRLYLYKRLEKLGVISKISVNKKKKWFDFTARAELLLFIYLIFSNTNYARQNARVVALSCLIQDSNIIRATVNANFTRPCFETYINFYDGFH